MGVVNICPVITRLDRSFPLQIGWKESVETIDAFFERHETTQFKFHVDSEGNVVIVEIEKAAHFATVRLLHQYFEVPNGGVFLNPPIDVMVKAGERIS